MTDETKQTDEALIDSAAYLATKAQDSNDPRVILLMNEAIEKLKDGQAIPTLLIRYNYLLNVERGQVTPQIPNPVLGEENG